MPELEFSQLSNLLDSIRKGTTPPVCLLFGDDFLVKSAFNDLLNAIVPSEMQTMNYEPLDGVTTSVQDLVECAVTYPFLPGNKVVALHDTILFSSSTNIGPILDRCRLAVESGDRNGIVRNLGRLLSEVGLTLEDLVCSDPAHILAGALSKHQEKAEPHMAQDVAKWLPSAIEQFVQAKPKQQASQQDADILIDLINSGFPSANHIVITADEVDKRRKLYKVIKTAGVILDCSLPAGDGKTRAQQESIMQSVASQRAKELGKTLGPDAFRALYEKLGGDLRTLHSEIGKLASFVGSRTRIGADDVREVSQRSKQDPIYELTNAIGQRDAASALRLIDGLLSSGHFPLQILAAMVNYIRKLVLAKDACVASASIAWEKGMSYQAFQRSVYPRLSSGDAGDFKGHPFVLYKIFSQAEGFLFKELAAAFETLLNADIKLKSGAQNPKLILEQIVFSVCGTHRARPS